MYNERRGAQAEINMVFYSKYGRLRGRLRQLSQVYTQAYAEGNQEMALAAMRQALLLKEGVGEQKEKGPLSAIKGVFERFL